jgi:hypothetical protein
MSKDPHGSRMLMNGWATALWVAAVAVALRARSALAQTSGGNPPPAPEARPALLSDHVLGSPEIQLALIVLAFGALLIALEAVVILKAALDSDTAVRLVTVTLVIVATLFTVAAGFGREEIAPIIGLFGTIIGYLLGRQATGGVPGERA